MSPRKRIRSSGKPLALGNILEGVFSRRGLKGRIRENRIFTVWDEAVGPGIAANARPVAVRDGVLTIEAKNSSWSQELSFMRLDIIRELNAGLGVEAISDLRFKVVDPSKPISANKTIKQADVKPRRPQIDPATENEIERRIEGIEDRDLRAALRSFMIKGATKKKPGGGR